MRCTNLASWHGIWHDTVAFGLVQCAHPRTFISLAQLCRGTVPKRMIFSAVASKLARDMVYLEFDIDESLARMIKASNIRSWKHSTPYRNRLLLKLGLG